MPRPDIINEFNNYLRRVPNSNYLFLPTNKFRLITQLLQLRRHFVPIIPLDLDIAVLHRTPRAALLLQLLCQGLHIPRRELQLHDHCHRLPAAPLLLAANAGRLLLRWQTFRLWTAARIAAAAWAALGRR